MKLAVVTTSYPWSDEDPAGHFVRSEVQQFVLDGHQVQVIAPRPANALARAARPTPTQSAQTPIHWIDAGRLFGWPGVLSNLKTAPWQAPNIAKFIAKASTTLGRHGPFDRVLAHWLLPCAWPIGVRASCPLEILLHGSDVRLFLRLPAWLRRRILRAVGMRDAQFRFVALHLLRSMTTAHPELAARSYVKSCRIHVPPLSQASARSTLNLPAEHFISVIVGRLIREKQVDAALAALERLPQDSRGIARTAVIGDGPEAGRLRRSFPWAQFLGKLPRSQTLTWLAAANQLVTASRTEGAPTAVREAEALGTPIVTLDNSRLVPWDPKFLQAVSISPNPE